MLTAQSPVVPSIRDMHGQWWLVQTKPQLERRLSRELTAARVQHLLPTEEIIKTEYDKQGRMHRRRADRVQFPGYLFLCSDAEGRYMAARSFATVRTIDIFNQARFVRELDSLVAALSINPALRMADGLARGKYVRIAAGAFIGICGRVEEINAVKMIVRVGIEAMGTHLPLEVPADFIELV